jgi:hypothetical protein
MSEHTQRKFSQTLVILLTTAVALGIPMAISAESWWGIPLASVVFGLPCCYLEGTFKPWLSWEVDRAYQQERARL